MTDGMPGLALARPWPIPGPALAWPWPGLGPGPLLEMLDIPRKLNKIDPNLGLGMSIFPGANFVESSP